MADREQAPVAESVIPESLDERYHETYLLALGIFSETIDNIADCVRPFDRPDIKEALRNVIAGTVILAHSDGANVGTRQSSNQEDSKIREEGEQ